MILCSCTRMTSRELREAVRAALVEERWTVITPGRAFHATGRRMKCGYCAALVSELIAEEMDRLRPGETTSNTSER